MTPIAQLSKTVPVATLTNFKDNVRSGVVQFPGGNSNSPGVMVGNLQAYAIKPNASANVLTAQTNPNGYISLASNVSAGFSVLDQRISFDVCRTLKITANVAADLTWEISGYDFYNKKMVWSGTVNVNTTISSPRGFNSICSVKMIGTGTFTLSTNNQIELPYADWNADNVLIVNYANEPLMWLDAGAAAPYTTSFQFDYFKSDPVQTGNSGRPRPIISITNATYGTPPFDGVAVMVVLQAVYGAGFNIPTVPNVTNPSSVDNSKPYLNLKEYVLGTPSYSEGWKEFQS